MYQQWSLYLTITKARFAICFSPKWATKKKTIVVKHFRAKPLCDRFLFESQLSSNDIAREKSGLSVDPLLAFAHIKCGSFRMWVRVCGKCRPVVKRKEFSAGTTERARFWISVRPFWSFTNKVVWLVSMRMAFVGCSLCGRYRVRSVAIQCLALNFLPLSLLDICVAHVVVFLFIFLSFFSATVIMEPYIYSHPNRYTKKKCELNWKRHSSEKCANVYIG